MELKHKFVKVSWDLESDDDSIEDSADFDMQTKTTDEVSIRKTQVKSGQTLKFNMVMKPARVDSFDGLSSLSLNTPKSSFKLQPILRVIRDNSGGCP